MEETFIALQFNTAAIKCRIYCKHDTPRDIHLSVDACKLGTDFCYNLLMEINSFAKVIICRHVLVL